MVEKVDQSVYIVQHFNSFIGKCILKILYQATAFWKICYVCKCKYFAIIYLDLNLIQRLIPVKTHINLIFL